MDRKTERQLVCGKRTCRNALQARSDLGCYHPSDDIISTPKRPINTGSKSCLKPNRGIEWAIAVNNARFRAPCRVLDVVFNRVPELKHAG
jgi:hypothetical protein